MISGILVTSFSQLIFAEERFGASADPIAHSAVPVRVVAAAAAVLAFARFLCSDPDLLPPVPPRPLPLAATAATAASPCGVASSDAALSVGRHRRHRN